jgi:hypothetical protein
MIHSRVLVPFAAGFYERFKKMGFSGKRKRRLTYAFDCIPLTSADRLRMLFVLKLDNYVRSYSSLSDCGTICISENLNYLQFSSHCAT